MNNGGIISDSSKGNLLKEKKNATHQTGVNPAGYPFCVTIDTENRKAKSIASEKMALSAEYCYKLPQDKFKMKNMAKRSSRSLSKDSNSVLSSSSEHRSRSIVGVTDVKIALTPCVAPAFNKGEPMTTSHLLNSPPQVQKTKSDPKTKGCKKRLDFHELSMNEQTPSVTSTSSNTVSLSPLSSPLSSPPKNHEVTLGQCSSTDTDDSESEVIDADGTSSIVADKHEFFLKKFSIPLTAVTTFQTI